MPKITRARLLVALSVILVGFLTGAYSGFPRHNTASGSHRGNQINIGFDLTHSYGTFALDLHNGTVLTAKIDGNEAYREVMKRLSLYSSCHLAPPYNDMDESFRDMPRRWKRSARKRIGLPASTDVGELAGLLRALKDEANRQLDPLSEQVTATLIAVPHLPALYEEDLVDAFDFVGLEYVHHRNWFRPLFWDTAVVYAGYGQGLCSAYTDPGSCRNETASMASIPVFSVAYTEDALTTAFSVIGSALGLWEPPYRTRVNLDLGSQHVSRRDYWDDVRNELYNLTMSLPLFPKPEKILITGDQASRPQLHQLVKELTAGFDTSPIIYSNESVFAAARGAAEFMKRASYAYESPPPKRPDNSTSRLVLQHADLVASHSFEF